MANRTAMAHNAAREVRSAEGEQSFQFARTHALRYFPMFRPAEGGKANKRNVRANNAMVLRTHILIVVSKTIE